LQPLTLARKVSASATSAVLANQNLANSTTATGQSFSLLGSMMSSLSGIFGASKLAQGCSSLASLL
jgi:hypothetical protein